VGHACRIAEDEAVVVSVESEGIRVGVGRDVATEDEFVVGQSHLTEEGSGDIRLIDDTDLFEKAPLLTQICASGDGYLESIDALAIGNLAMRAGAGRARKEDQINFAAGILLKKKPGDRICAGDVLAESYHRQPLSEEWMNECKPALTQADRPIHLPYTIETMDEVTRDETILRKGSVQQGDLEKELTEKSFWQHFVPYLINKYYGHDSLKGELLEQSVNGDLWNGITNLVLDIYRQMKVVFCDSILDDNNNIIDYSMDNELPVVRLNITYKYRA
jgi:hypothetical protein